MFQLEAISPSPITTGPCKNFLSSLLQAPSRYWKAAVSSPQNLLQAEQPQLSQSIFNREVLHPSSHLCGPPVDLLYQSVYFLKDYVATYSPLLIKILMVYFSGVECIQKSVDAYHSV